MLRSARAAARPTSLDLAACLKKNELKTGSYSCLPAPNRPPAHVHPPLFSSPTYCFISTPPNWSVPRNSPKPAGAGFW